MGAKNGGLIHIIWHELGPEGANKFITGAQRLVDNWLVNVGLVLGLKILLLMMKQSVILRKLSRSPRVK